MYLVHNGDGKPIAAKIMPRNDTAEKEKAIIGQLALFEFDGIF